jgi:NAD(P)-dependent dehydrogenase (short-subunit alcohol dehydrogenase family)
MTALLAGKVAVVTGAARGIGRACATNLVSSGAEVVIIDRLAEAASETARAIGPRARSLHADLTDTPGLEALARAAEAAFGRIDILVNNAGISTETPTLEIDEAQWDRTMQVNLKTLFFTTQALLPALLRQRRGAIVNVSSIVARSGGVNSTADYTASKGGVLSLTRQLAREFGPRGIRVNAVTPGPVMTEMIGHWAPEKLADLVGRIPLQRLGTADDVAHSVVFLASPWADYLTGVAIDVAGGIFMA